MLTNTKNPIIRAIDNNRIIARLISSKIFGIPIKVTYQAFVEYLLSNNGVIIYYRDSESSSILKLIYEIKQDKKLLLDYYEAYGLYMAVIRVGKIEGDIAEVGVYRGGSARLIAEAKGSKKLHLFDTFEGLPKLSKNDDSIKFHENQYTASFDNVKNYLKKYPNVYLYKGMFPGTGKSVENEKFSFVHLDVDIYESTLDCLAFFYPKVSKGGIIISHDYVTSKGVKKAFDEFFKNKPETIIEFSGNEGQCLVVKLQ